MISPELTSYYITKKYNQYPFENEIVLKKLKTGKRFKSGLLMTMVYKDIYSIIKDEPWKTFQVNFNYLSEYLDYLYRGEIEIQNDPSLLLLKFLDDINDDFSFYNIIDPSKSQFMPFIDF